ncbi:hypothetical protein [Ignavibacterium album]|uniref:hypothetical protein n=1 Tax=Ignavibacterium album TaxID=591197 RepID=UPI0026F07755|nr:hypothetical protein [Ignavibacterium album]
MNNELLQIQSELQKRLSIPYQWNRKQNDFLDNKTNFIYHIKTFEELLTEIDKRFKSDKNFKMYYDYSLNRWFNFWSAYALEKIFCSLPNVKPAFNHRDRLKDFSIQGINFDHKSSVYPMRFGYDIDYAQHHPEILIKWLYENQSTEKRKHFRNRLFIVLYNTPGEHWKLKAEIMWLKDLIENYVSNFDPNKLFSLKLKNDFITYSDIIWAIK